MKPMFVNAGGHIFEFAPFQPKHGTAERWNACDCDECVEARRSLDEALVAERARREAPPSWHEEPKS